MPKESSNNYRFVILLFAFFLFGGIIIARLFVLQILNYDHYSALSSGQYDVFKELFPERGNIYLSDQGQMTPIAVNKDVGLVFAQPNIIENPKEVFEKLIEILEITDEEELEKIMAKLEKEDDPYEVIQKRVPDEKIQLLKAADLEGIFISTERMRFYPDKNLFSHITGFVSKRDDGTVGQYGFESYFDDELRGKQGYLDSERDALGRWIVIAKRDYVKAKNGQDLKITIDKAVQLKTREILEDAIELYEAEKGSILVIDPQTGAIISMVNYPDYDPNEYYNVEDYGVYNNQAIYSPYEPGSIFKAVVMAAALDLDKISPSTTYEDLGFIKYDDGYQEFTIYNSDKEAHGIQTMTEVLEKSLNTGTIFAMQQIGAKNFKEYVEAFGFGELTGIELVGEKAGNISSLETSLKKKGEIYAATASYGQGITVTPLQMIMAIGAIANGGKLMKPYLLEDIISKDDAQHFKPEVIRQVISPRAATLLSGMMVSVIDNGHGSKAQIPGYYLAGKTGTAEVAEKGVYGSRNIHSFIGFGPVDDARFAILIKLDNPQKGSFSSQTAAPVFHQVAKYLLGYYHIPPQY